MFDVRLGGMAPVLQAAAKDKLELEVVAAELGTDFELSVISRLRVPLALRDGQPRKVPTPMRVYLRPVLRFDSQQSSLDLRQVLAPIPAMAPHVRQVCVALASSRLFGERNYEMATPVSTTSPGKDHVSTPDHTNESPNYPADAASAWPWAGSSFALRTGWAFGALIFVGLITLILRFGDIENFLTTVRQARPIWLGAALACQSATYLCAALLWYAILQRAKSPLPLWSLLRLALMELVANQAIPTAGLSGSLLVMHGLTRRGVAPAIALTALLIETVSYYAAYLLIGLLAFVLFWHTGDLSLAWRSLLIAFAVVIGALGAALAILSRAQGRLIPHWALQWRPFAKLAEMLDRVRSDLLRSPVLLMSSVTLQLTVFLLDSATLWCASRAIGLDLDLARTFTSFVLASIVATLSPIPLGLGSFEVSCTGLLHLLGGGLEASFAATLILRGLTLWLPMLPGLWIIRREIAMTKPMSAAAPTSS